MRYDKRAFDELRPVTIEPNFTSAPLGSALYRAGGTLVLCTASLEDGVPRWLQGGEPPRGWVTAEYQMLPGSTERRSRRERQKVGGRTLEIQRLIGRSLRAIVDFEALGERTITIDCEVLQADGGTRTASITGGFVALCLAAGRLVERGAIERMPLKGSVAAISCGVVGGELMLDLPYEEDARADVDFNVVMTGSGRFIEVQGTGEGGTFERSHLNGLIDLAGAGIDALTIIQREAIEGAGGKWPS